MNNKIEFLIKQDNILQNLKMWLNEQEKNLKAQYELLENDIKEDRYMISAFLLTIITVKEKIKELEK